MPFKSKAPPRPNAVQASAIQGVLDRYGFAGPALAVLALCSCASPEAQIKFKNDLQAKHVAEHASRVTPADLEACRAFHASELKSRGFADPPRYTANKFLSCAIMSTKGLAMAVDQNDYLGFIGEVGPNAKGDTAHFECAYRTTAAGATFDATLLKGVAGTTCQGLDDMPANWGERVAAAANAHAPVYMFLPR